MVKVDVVRKSLTAPIATFNQAWQFIAVEELIVILRQRNFLRVSDKPIKPFSEESTPTEVVAKLALSWSIFATLQAHPFLRLFFIVPFESL